MGDTADLVVVSFVSGLLLCYTGSLGLSVREIQHWRNISDVKFVNVVGVLVFIVFVCVSFFAATAEKMPKRQKKLAPYWLFAIDHARCYGERVCDIYPEDVSIRWEAASREIKNIYREDTRELNHKYGKDAEKIAGARGLSLVHAFKDCQCGARNDPVAEECRRWYGEEYTVDQYLEEKDMHCPHYL